MLMISVFWIIPLFGYACTIVICSRTDLSYFPVGKVYFGRGIGRQHDVPHDVCTTLFPSAFDLTVRCLVGNIDMVELFDVETRFEDDVLETDLIGRRTYAAQLFEADGEGRNVCRFLT